MNKEKTRIQIYCADGDTDDVTCDAVYGCSMEEDEKGGIHCKNFFTGRINIMKVPVPIGSGICLVVEQMSQGDKNLESLLLRTVHNVIMRRLDSLASEIKENGGSEYGGN